MYKGKGVCVYMYKGKGVCVYMYKGKSVYICKRVRVCMYVYG